MKPPWPIFPNPGFPALELFELSNTIPLTSSPGSLISDPCLHFHVTPVAVPGAQDLSCLLSRRGCVSFSEPGPFQSQLFNCGNILFFFGGGTSRGGYNGLVQLLG